MAIFVVASVACAQTVGVNPVQGNIASGSADGGNPVKVGAVYNTSAPTPAAGQRVDLQADQAGNVRTFPGTVQVALSAWSSSTALNATQNIFTNSGAAGVLVQLVQTTTLTAGAVTFENTYDGTNWVTVNNSYVLDPTASVTTTIAIPYTVQASTNKPFLIVSNGWQGLRIKLSTQITGTGTVTPNYTLLPYMPQGVFATAAAGVIKVGLTDASGNNINSTSNALNVSLAANQSVNLAQVAGATTATSATGVQKVGIVGNAGGIVDAATGASVPANAIYIGGKGSGNLVAPIVCDNWTAINISTGTTTKIIALASAKNTYICSFHLFSAGTDNAAWISGTKTTNECDTGAAGLAGGTTAASGYNFTAQTGIAAAGSFAPLMATATTGKDVCIITSAAVQLSGAVNWTQF